MSFGIPIRYMAAPDRELARDREEYGQARRFGEGELHSAVISILGLLTSEMLHGRMHQLAERTASGFQESNEDGFVVKYLVCTEEDA